jgi:type IV pilus assembly protein PilC
MTLNPDTPPGVVSDLSPKEQAKRDKEFAKEQARMEKERARNQKEQGKRDTEAAKQPKVQTEAQLARERAGLEKQRKTSEKNREKLEAREASQKAQQDKILRELIEKAARPVKEKVSRRPQWLEFDKNVKPVEVAESLRILALMLETARGETRPLATLAEQYKKTELGNAYARMYQLVASGQKSFSAAMREEEKIFPRIVADLLHVGAQSGAEAVNLKKGAEIMLEGQDLKQKIKSATMQPIILFTVIILFLYAVILFVLPVFADMFESLGKPLPPLSQFVMDLGTGLIWVGAIAIVSGISWFIYYKFWGRYNERLRMKLGRMSVKVPILGKVLQSQRLVQVFSILSGLLEVGMSDREALKTAAEASSNAAYKYHLLAHIRRMDNGTSDFAGVADGYLIPPSAGFIMRNGFDSGSEIKALANLTDFYRREAHKRTENLTTALQPIANGAVGLIMVLVIVSTYLPIYDMFLGLTEV